VAAAIKTNTKSGSGAIQTCDQGPMRASSE